MFGAGAKSQAEEKVRYDGSACINVRSVVDVCKLLHEGGSVEPLSWKELSDVLWFIETCVTSKNLFFDGTVPQQTAAQAVDAVEKLKRGNELESFQISAITPEGPKELLETARAAMAQAWPVLNRFSLDPELDRPLEQSEHENFFRRLEQALDSAPEQRESLAQEWVSDDFRGGKCLAALIANGDQMLALGRRLYDQYPGQGALVTAAMINRFRLNYVNHLAAGKRSAYVPDPRFENVTKEHVWLFKDYLIEQLQKDLKVAPGEINIIEQNMKSDDPLPSIGLFALMATKTVKRPVAILEKAYNEFRQDSRLMKLIWENTRGGITLRKGKTADEYVPQIEQHFYDKYKALEEEAAGIQVLSSRMRSARSYLLPAVLKAAVGVLGLSMGVGIGATVLTVLLAEGAIPLLSDTLKARGCNSYISQYKRLKRDLQDDSAIKVPLAKLSEHVSRVFGRPLKADG